MIFELANEAAVSRPGGCVGWRGLAFASRLRSAIGDALTCRGALKFARRMIVAAALCVPLLVLAGEPEAVGRCFEDYKSAILRQKGDAAAGLVTTKTIDEYQRYVDWAMSADRRTLESLSLVNRFQVLLLRQRIPAETLSRLNGRSVFVYAVDRDWIGKDSVIRTTLGTVNVAGNRATSEVLIGGQTAPHRFHFTRENGAWRFDLVQLLQATDQALRAVARQRGMSEDEFIFSLIETASGKRVEPAIWVPVQKRLEARGPQEAGRPLRAAANRAAQLARES